jgi:hypothetical protein
MTFFSQVAGLAVQTFVSAGVGMCVAVALIRGIVARSDTSLGTSGRRDRAGHPARRVDADLTRSHRHPRVVVPVLGGSRLTLTKALHSRTFV